MFGRATIRLGIGPHSSWIYFLLNCDKIDSIVTEVSMKFLFQTAWTTDARGLRPATKSAFMTILQNISYVLIKSRYHAYPTDVRYVCPVLFVCSNCSIGCLRDICAIISISSVTLDPTHISNSIMSSWIRARHCYYVLWLITLRVVLHVTK